MGRGEVGGRGGRVGGLRFEGGVGVVVGEGKGEGGVEGDDGFCCEGVSGGLGFGEGTGGLGIGGGGLFDVVSPKGRVCGLFIGALMT